MANDILAGPLHERRSGRAEEAGLVNACREHAIYTGAHLEIDLSASQNDWDIEGLENVSVLLVNCTVAGLTVTGIKPKRVNQRLSIFNVGTASFTLASQSASSLAAYRMALGGDVAVVADSHGLSLYRDDVDTRWRPTSGGGRETKHRSWIEHFDSTLRTINDGTITYELPMYRSGLNVVANATVPDVAALPAEGNDGAAPPQPLATWRLGIHQFSTDTAATSQIGVGTFNEALYLGNGRAYFSSHIRIPALSTAAQEFVFHAGVSNLYSLADTFTCFIYDRATFGANWHLDVGGAVAPFAPLDAGLAVTAGLFYHWELAVDGTDGWTGAATPPIVYASAFLTEYSATGVKGARNSLGQVPVPTYLFDGEGYPAIPLGFIAGNIIKTAGTTARTFDIDLADGWMMDEYTRTPDIYPRPF